MPRQHVVIALMVDFFVFLFCNIFSCCVAEPEPLRVRPFLAEAGLSFFFTFWQPWKLLRWIFWSQQSDLYFLTGGISKAWIQSQPERTRLRDTLLMQQSPVNDQICKKKLALKNNDKNPTLMMSCCLTCTVVHIWKVFNYLKTKFLGKADFWKIIYF